MRLSRTAALAALFLFPQSAAISTKSSKAATGQDNTETIMTVGRIDKNNRASSLRGMHSHRITSEDTNGSSFDEYVYGEFRRSHHIRNDAELKYQFITEQTTITANQKVYSLDNLNPVDVYSKGAEYSLDNIAKGVLDENDVNVFSRTDEDGDTIVVTKGSEGEILTVEIFGEDGSDIYMASIAPDVLATISPEDIDHEFMQKFRVAGVADTVASLPPGGRSLQNDYIPDQHEGPKRFLQTNCPSFNIIEIAVVYDSTFCAHAGGASQAKCRIENIVARASAKYQKQGVCTKMRISYIEGHCDAGTDPYRTGVDSGNIGCDANGGGVLGQFMSYWSLNRSNVQRDVAHIFFARDFDETIIGCAFIGTLCQKSSGYGAIDAKYSDDEHLLAATFAHEVGHNIGLDHVNANDKIMSATIGDADDPWSDLSIQRIDAILPQAYCISEEENQTHTYYVTIRTGDVADAGTDSNIYLTIYGEKGDSGEVRLNGLISGNAFEREDVDKVSFVAQDVGTVTKVNIYSDGAWAAPDWFLSSISIDGKYFAKFDRWVEEGCEGSPITGAPKDYTVKVKTGDVANAGTDSNIYLTIYGEKGDTGEVRLNGLISGNAFERNDLDTVTLVGLLDVGTVTKIKVRSDGTYLGSDWWLTSVKIDDKYYARFNKWIEEGSYEASVTDPPRDYVVKVKTGDVSGAGTDSNIFVTINGNKGSTQEKRLNGYISGNAFERNDLDTVTLGDLDDVGTLTSVKIRSDGKWLGSDWYLSWVSVDDQTATFNRWIDGVSATANFPTTAPTPSCMSGETGVLVEEGNQDDRKEILSLQEETQAHVVKVRDLKFNDTIHGLDENKEPTKCKVEAVGNFGFGPVYGNYTDGHYVLNPDTGNVERHGNKELMSVQDKYIVVTSCPLGIDESGVGFTPFDSDFFGELTKEMSWKDYLLLHTAILRVVRATGGFWFQGSSYIDLAFLHEHASVMCSTILQCMKDHDQCEDLEDASKVFIERTLTGPAKEKAYSAFHNIGKHRKLGSASATVSGGGSVRK